MREHSGGSGGKVEEPGSPLPLEVRRLGLVPYARGITLQESLVVRRRCGEIPDQLLLLEHPHVITLGSGAEDAHVLADSARRAELGIELARTGRGGDVTYHGPGQLVGYPILDLKPDRRDLHRYLRDLEEVLVRTLGAFGVTGRRVSGRTGVWTAAGKVAAIGVRVSSGWITSHGFALNVSTDLSYFDAIVPCGITEESVTSLNRLLGWDPSIGEVSDQITTDFEAVFGRVANVMDGDL